MAKKNLTFKEKLEEAIVKEGPYEVPGNWVWSNINSINIKFTDGDWILSSNFVDNGTVKLLQLSDIGEGKYLGKSRKYITEEKFGELNCTEISCGDLLISRMAEPIGRSIICPELDNKLITVVDVSILSVDNNYISNRYLNYLFNSSYFMKECESLARGTTRLRITRKNLGVIPIPVPPLKEQQRIVNKIGSLFEKLDKAKELIKEAREGFEKRKSAVLEKAFRGELTEKWRRENSNLAKAENLIESIKEERYSIIKANKEKKEIDLAFSEHNYNYEYVPNKWIKVKSSMICDTITSGKTPKDGVSDSGDIPFLKVYNIVDNKISFSYRSQFISKEIHEGAMKSSNLIEKDIVMNIVGPPLRKVAIITDEYAEWNMNQNMVRFRPIKLVDYKYLYYCLLREETLNKAIDESKGVVGQIIISTVKCRNLEIPVPSLSEQKEIVRILDNTYNKDITIDELTDLEELIESIKKAILAKAFRGELETNCEEDESAFELLKKILSKE